MLLLLIFSCFLRAFCHSASILCVFQNPTYSHIVFQESLMEALAARGHNLTVFTPRLMNLGHNNNNVRQHLFEDSAEIQRRHVNPLRYKLKGLHWLSIIANHELKAFNETKNREVAHPEMQRLLHRPPAGTSFDALIIECVFCDLAVLADIYDCPIVVSSMVEATNTMHALMGNDVSPALFPDTNKLPYLHRHLTFGERVHSLLTLALTFSAVPLIFGAHQRNPLLPHSNRSGLEIFRRRTALLLINTNAAFGYVRPLMPNTVQIGSIHVRPPQPLEDAQLLNFLDSAVDGAVVMAFGSLADTSDLTGELCDKFLAVISRSRLRFLWKTHELGRELPRNLLVREWLPQADVLAHPNVKLLITHGGLLTAYEAIDREIPMVVFPLAYDQAANAKMLAHRKVAMELDLNDFEERHLAEAIAEMTKAKYKNNVRQLKRRVYDQPLTSRQLAVWHIERVLRNKNDLLFETAGVQEQIQRYYLDLIALVFIFALISWWLMGKIVSGIFSVFRKGHYVEIGGRRSSGKSKTS